MIIAISHYQILQIQSSMYTFNWLLNFYLFVVVQIMIIDYKLPYPSGTATAVLINGFHTPKGDKMAKYAKS